MSLFSSIQSFGPRAMPPHVPQPVFPPALSGNPEAARVAMYGGGGAPQPGVSGDPTQHGPAGADGSQNMNGAPVAAGSGPSVGNLFGGNNGGLLASIAKLFGNSSANWGANAGGAGGALGAIPSGAGDDAIMSFLAGL